MKCILEWTAIRKTKFTAWSQGHWAMWHTPFKYNGYKSKQGWPVLTYELPYSFLKFSLSLNSEPILSLRMGTLMYYNLRRWKMQEVFLQLWQVKYSTATSTFSRCGTISCCVSSLTWQENYATCYHQVIAARKTWLTEDAYVTDKLGNKIPQFHSSHQSQPKNFEIVELSQ